MKRIVTYAHRPERPPKKRKPVALPVPSVVAKSSRRHVQGKAAAEVMSPPSLPEEGAAQPSTSHAAKRPAIVTSRKAAASALRRSVAGRGSAARRCSRGAIPRVGECGEGAAMREPPTRHWRSGLDRPPGAAGRAAGWPRVERGRAAACWHGSGQHGGGSSGSVSGLRRSVRGAATHQTLLLEPLSPEAPSRRQQGG